MRASALLLIGLAPVTLGGCNSGAHVAPAYEAQLELTGRVVDTAELLPSLIKQDMTAQLAAIEDDTKAQLVVVTTATLNGYEISDYSLQLANGWGVGDKKRNDGLLLVVAPNERKVRIEVGRGLEQALPDERCEEFIDMMLPYFRDGDYVAGIQTGVDLLDRELRTKLESIG